jgi:hypothetical protein
LNVKALQRLRRSTASLLMAGVLLTGVPCAAQMLPSEPLVFGGGRVTIGGDVSATYSCADANQDNEGACPDDTGFFNYTDYEHSALRMVRFDVTAAVKASEHLSFLTEIRSENAGSPQPYGLYARIRPWAARPFDIQIGRVPPTFGAFARRTYPADNMLIGYPLAYQYLTSLRADSLPRNADELLRMRGRGWLSNFSVGDLSPDRGLALVSAFRWDTGIQVHAANEFVDTAVAVTTGTLGNPLVGDDNSGRQVAGRIALKPTPAWVIGLSLARGPYLTRDASEGAGEGGRTGPFTQTGWGADVEYSRDYYLLRFETIVSDWRLPLVGTPAIDLPLRAVSTLVEGRYRIRPGIYAAARLDHLGFSEVVGATTRDSWDAPVTRVEIGGGFSLQRNLLLKLAVQHNSRRGGRVTRENVGSAQLVFWL